MDSGSNSMIRNRKNKSKPNLSSLSRRVQLNISSKTLVRAIGISQVTKSLKIEFIAKEVVRVIVKVGLM